MIRVQSNNLGFKEFKILLNLNKSWLNIGVATATLEKYQIRSKF